MADVFLSYSREDEPTARRFAESLKREGFSVWWDQSLDAGEAFDRVTEQALDAALAVVVLWSKKSVESRWVRAEATQAQASGRLVPVMIGPCRRPIMFELTHTADLADWDGDAADERWCTFVDGLRRLITGGAATGNAPVTREAGPARRARRRFGPRPVALIATLSALAGALLAWALTGRDSPVPPAPLRLALSFDGTPQGLPVGSRHIAISGDGSIIAFASSSQLLIRDLHHATPVAVDVRCSNPFFSPDRAWVGCMGEPNLVKVPVAGGTPVKLALTSERTGGATWGRNGLIVFATTEGLFSIPADGGTPELIAAPKRSEHERLYAWPEFLPDDETVLFTVLMEDLDAAPVTKVLDLHSRESRTVLTGGSGARYVATGHLVYAVGGKLHATRFDARRNESRGVAAALPDLDVGMTSDNGAAEFAIASNGTMALIPPTTAAPRDTEYVWIGRDGVRTPLGLPPGRYTYPRISPDGKRIAFDVNNGKNRDLWIWNPGRGSLTPLTLGPTEDMLPVWSADGSRVFFASNRSGNTDVYSQAADGSSDARIEYAGPGTEMPQSATTDGHYLVVYENFRDFGLLDLRRGTLQPLLHDDFQYWISAVSPDSRWIAYESRESGNQTEIFVRPFPEVGARREKISIDGGRYPLWSKSGAELFYVNPKGEVLSVGIQSLPELQVGKARKLFDWQPPPPVITGRPYDVSPVDGRFLVPVNRPASAAGTVTQVAVTLNWAEDLRKLIP